jgi:hypothetical protein
MISTIDRSTRAKQAAVPDHLFKQRDIGTFIALHTFPAITCRNKRHQSRPHWDPSNFRMRGLSLTSKCKSSRKPSDKPVSILKNAVAIKRSSQVESTMWSRSSPFMIGSHKTNGRTCLAWWCRHIASRRRWATTFGLRGR